MALLVQLPPLPEQLTDDDGEIELVVGRPGAEHVLRLVLAWAVWHRASSVHYHPWLGEDALGMIVAGVRYCLNSPPQEVADHLISAARRLLEQGGLARLARRLLGWPARLPLAGRLVLQFGEERSDWCGVCWAVDGAAGVDFYRLDVTGIQLIAQPSTGPVAPAPESGD